MIEACGGGETMPPTDIPILELTPARFGIDVPKGELDDDAKVEAGAGNCGYDIPEEEGKF